MKLHLYLIIIAAATSSNSFCQHNNQSVIAVAGNISKAGNITLEWTLGEPAIETVSTTLGLLTQGFHQPLLEVQRVNNTNSNLVKNIFRVFPNPVTSVLNIQLDNAVKERLLVSLVDINGRVLQNNIFPQETTAIKIDVSRYTHGTYFLRIINHIGSIHSEFKVIKAK